MKWNHSKTNPQKAERYKKKEDMPSLSTSTVFTTLPNSSLLLSLFNKNIIFKLYFISFGFLPKCLSQGPCKSSPRRLLAAAAFLLPLFLHPFTLYFSLSSTFSLKDGIHRTTGKQIERRGRKEEEHPYQLSRLGFWALHGPWNCSQESPLGLTRFI